MRHNLKTFIYRAVMLYVYHLVSAVSRVKQYLCIVTVFAALVYLNLDSVIQLVLAVKYRFWFIVIAADRAVSYSFIAGITIGVFIVIIIICIVV